MIRFHDKVYAHSKKGLLVWEPSWETFRPVIAVVWNPIHNQLEPYYGVYTNDVFDVEYGFKNSEIHEYCVEFTDENAHHIGGAEEIEDIALFWRWCGTQLVWVGDRAMAVHPCAGNPERKKYLQRYQLRAKTCKRAPRNLRGTLKVSKH